MTPRERYLLKTYNITEDDYERLLAAHQGNCWICGRPPKNRRLHVEHDHKTGRVRGLACWHCNRGLQQFSDSPARLRAAAMYLESLEADRILFRKETNGNSNPTT